jgi:hypothetical protein
VLCYNLYCKFYSIIVACQLIFPSAEINLANDLETEGTGGVEESVGYEYSI